MAIKNAQYGGSDWSDGDVLEAVDLNDTFNATGGFRRENFTLAGPVSANPTSFADIAGGAFTITDGLNNLMIGIHVKLQLKNDTGGKNTDVSLKIDGTNLGTKYLISNAIYAGNAGTIQGTVFIAGSEAALFAMVGTAYLQFSAPFFVPLKLLDATTTFTLRYKTQSGGNVFVQTVAVEVVYTRAFIDD